MISTRISGIELGCWIVSGLIVVFLVASLIMQIASPPAAPPPPSGAHGVAAQRGTVKRPSAEGVVQHPRPRPSTAPGTSARAARAQRASARVVAPLRPPPQDTAQPRAPSVTDANTRYDPSGNFMLLGGGAPPPVVQSDTSDSFHDTGNELESFPMTDKQKVMWAANTRAGMNAEMDTGNATKPPSRVVGPSEVSWMSILCDKKVRTIGSESVPFGGSSHLETARAAAMASAA